MEEEEACNIGLGLGLGWGDEFAPKRNPQRQLHNKPPVQFHLLFPSHPKEEIFDEEHDVVDRSSSKTVYEDEEYASKNYSTSDNNGGTRKKLRLTKEQSTLLEDSFKEHNTLNPTQKQELVERLNLRPRQVEVWFQNRRARTKLKQTEVDCEFLKKCCESLSDENQRLKKELQELRSIKLGASPFYIQLPKAATLTMCPSCERIGKTSEGKNKAVFDVVGKTKKFYSGFGDSSLAC